MVVVVVAVAIFVLVRYPAGLDFVQKITPDQVGKDRWLYEGKKKIAYILVSALRLALYANISPLLLTTICMSLLL